MWTWICWKEGFLKPPCGRSETLFFWMQPRVSINILDKTLLLLFCSQTRLLFPRLCFRFILQRTFYFSGFLAQPFTLNWRRAHNGQEYTCFSQTPFHKAFLPFCYPLIFHIGLSLLRMLRVDLAIGSIHGIDRLDMTTGMRLSYLEQVDRLKLILLCKRELQDSLKLLCFLILGNLWWCCHNDPYGPATLALRNFPWQSSACIVPRDRIHKLYHIPFILVRDLTPVECILCVFRFRMSHPRARLLCFPVY